jgi:hypothetical protein
LHEYNKLFEFFVSLIAVPEAHTHSVRVTTCVELERRLLRRGPLAEVPFRWATERDARRPPHRVAILLPRAREREVALEPFLAVALPAEPRLAPVRVVGLLRLALGDVRLKRSALGSRESRHPRGHVRGVPLACVRPAGGVRGLLAEREEARADPVAHAVVAGRCFAGRLRHCAAELGRQAQHRLEARQARERESRRHDK